MGSKKDFKRSVERLENLKQGTILNSLESIDLDNEIDLYDTMIHLFAEGELDDYFSSETIENMDDDQKKKVHELARKYESLCFFAGNPDYWIDSIEGFSLNDLDFICMRIFDNYNFLLELIVDGDLEVLEELKSIQATDLFSDKVVIDYLRNVFNDDNFLKETLRDFENKDEEYSNLSALEKSLLLLNPEGVLYQNDSVKERVSLQELKDKIAINSGLSEEKVKNISLVDLIDKIGVFKFQEILSKIYLDYLITGKELEEKTKKSY